MTTTQTQIILNTWAAVSKIDDAIVGSIFYDRLFKIAPQLRSMFRQPIPEQSKKLMAMLHYLIHNLNKPEDISKGLSNLAQRHIKYNVKPEHYDIVGNVLLYTLEKGLGHLWNDEVNDAWIALYTTVAGIMMTACNTINIAA